MNNQIIAPYLRKRWEDARKKVQSLSPELFPQSSYLRIDQTLTDGVGSYAFDPMRQNGQKGTYGQLLNRNDLFLTYGVGLFLNYQLTANPGASVLATSLSDLVAKAKVMGSTDTIPVDVQCIYNGALRLQTGTTVTFEALETSIFNVSHQAANSGTTEAAVVSLDSSILDEIFYTPEMIAFAGTKEQTFNLTFPCANTSKFQPTSSPKGSVGLSLIMLGFLVKNGALLLENYKGDVNSFLAPA